MADWTVMDREWPPDGSYDPFYGMDLFYQEKPPVQEVYPSSHAQQFVDYGHENEPRESNLPPSALSLLLSPTAEPAASLAQMMPLLPPQLPNLPLQQMPVQDLPAAPPYNQEYTLVPRGDNPREIRNKAEKQRRDKLNHSISELAAMVPPVVAANRKIDKTGVLRLTAHYLRAHQYVFGDSIGKTTGDLKPAAAQTLLSMLNGFLLTTTYKGLVVVVSQNVQQYLGYSELDLLGQNVFNFTHQDDHQTLRENLMPKSHLLGPNGELLIPDEPDGTKKVSEELASEKKRFIVRFKKHSQRSEPVHYVSCFVEGTLRKSDRACRGYNRCSQVVRRARARGDNPCSSGNDVVFIGVVRPHTETFMTESNIEAFRMEYRTRHSIGGEIMECEQRISLVTGYMTHEVNGTNAMNFMHKDDVRWVIFALRKMYQQQSLVGESCYRLMAKNGQFIYLRTVGKLDVDQDSRAVRSFVCVNTVVDEDEGKHLIEMMKKKYMMNINNDIPQEVEDGRDMQEDQTLPVEDPRNLEKVILYLVTDLPASKCDSHSSDSGGVPERVDSPSLPLAIIPPRKERIISSIEKIYTVIKAFKREPDMANRPGQDSSNFLAARHLSPARSPDESPSRTMTGAGRAGILLRRQLDGKNIEEEFYLGDIPTQQRRFETVASTTNNGDTVFVSLHHVPSPEENKGWPKKAIPPSIQPINEAEFDTANLRRRQKDFLVECPTTIIEIDSEASADEGPQTSGTKRPNDPSGEASSSKRRTNENQPGSTNKLCKNNITEPLLGTKLLNETMLSSAMDTIENDIDSSFPDLLAQDVGDFLDQIENQPEVDEKIFSEDSLL